MAVGKGPSKESAIGLGFLLPWKEGVAGVVEIRDAMAGLALAGMAAGVAGAAVVSGALVGRGSLVASGAASGAFFCSESLASPSGLSGRSLG